MKNVIMTGATGMIGSLVLKYCLESKEIGQVTSFVRRKTDMSHTKLTEIVHENFLDYSSVVDAFKDVNIAYFCLGVYTGAVSRNEFRTITIDYTKVFADALKKSSPSATFCFLSGQGADETEKSRLMFAKDKGIAENYLKKLTFDHLYIFRPGYIYPVTPRVEPNFSYKLFRYLYPIINAVFPNASVTSEHLAKVIFKKGFEPDNKIIFENTDIRECSIT